MKDNYNGQAKIEEINELLQEELPESAIKQREGMGGMTLDYLEGWWVKKNANRIFGVGNWDMEVHWDHMRKHKLGEKNGNEYGLFKVPVTVTVTLPNRTTKHSDVGVTMYHSTNNYEMAIKGCVTDGMKRCFSSFGEQFGLGLYDSTPEEGTRPASGGPGRIKNATYEELLDTYGLNSEQQKPTCPRCGVDMRLVQTKDGSRVFWGCPNYRDGCKKTYSVRDIAVDGSEKDKEKSVEEEAVEELTGSVGDENVDPDEIPEDMEDNTIPF